ncbi:MAG: YdcF family protein [Alphaproteobacteria bacterium]|nr:YdcF family protein [Alphaproteobacteria bacterium SS10]
MTRWPIWGKRLALGAAGLLLLVGLLPVGDFLIRPLEARFPAIEDTGDRGWGLGQRPHIAVVLGGAVQPVLSNGAEKIAVNGAAERLLATAAMAKREPGLAIIVSGGAGSLWSGDAEAPLIAEWLSMQGVPGNQLILDDKSRNTYENANFSIDILKQSIPSDQRMRLAIITSAAHMPRAIGSFRRAAAAAGLLELDLLAYPVDYRSTPVPLLRIQRVGDGLSNLDAASREWLALLAYFFLDRIDSPLPGPDMHDQPMAPGERPEPPASPAEEDTE